MNKQIIAIGGGGFGSEQSALTLERYLCKQTGKAKPKICFLPQASNEASDYIVRFYDCFTKLGAVPSWLSLFGRVPYDWAGALLSQDIIYVGGGNTKSMLALWKAWGLDIVLKEAYDRGIMLCGVSAGAICWFEQGLSDSEWPLIGLECLGILPGSCCPHFDSESDRPDTYRKKIGEGSLKPGIALDDHTAAHYIDGKLKRVVAASPGRTARVMAATGEESLPIELLV